MPRRTSRCTIAVGVVLALVCVLVAPVSAAVTPTTTITLAPVSPNGTPPWYVVSPEVFLASSQTGTITYSWSGGPGTTVPVVADVQVSIGFAPDGEHLLSAFAVSPAGTEAPVAQRLVKTDPHAPGRPTGFTALGSAGSVAFSWSGAADTGASGVAGYSVYRSDDEVLFDVGDLIGEVASTSFEDAEDLDGLMLWYAVATRDRAGNVSPLTDSVRAGRANRIAGDDRFATALAASRDGFADSSVATVVVASGLDYPDALCASGLAGVLDSPVLLVGKGAISNALRDELTRLGATDAFVIGGRSAVSAQTLTSLDSALSGSATRIAGADRYATARLVARKIIELRGTTPDRAYLVSGANFPDALSVAPAAYAEAAPVLFARPTSLPASTASALALVGAPETLIAGCVDSIWLGADALVPGAKRVAGPDRFATSRAIADWAELEGVLGGSALYMATGWDFPDGLAGAPLAGREASPLIVVSASDVAGLRSWLRADPARFSSAHILGSASSVDPAVASAVARALTIN